MVHSGYYSTDTRCIVRKKEGHMFKDLGRFYISAKYSEHYKSICTFKVSQRFSAMAHSSSSSSYL